MKKHLLAILILITLVSCKKDSAEDNYAFIGGEIINPINNFVFLEKNESIINVIKLDGRNRFIYKIDNLDKGLYTFRHGGEYQIVLLEPKDSLLFRLNTLEFDESLVFTGKGAKKNNYFINEFLNNEQEEKYILKLCQLQPKKFQKHLDSLKAKKIKKLNYFKSKYGSSDLFDKIAQANIEFCHYSSKEVYPFVNYSRNKKDILQSLPDNFYDYQKDINYNDAFFSKYYNYISFLKRNISNLALKKHTEHSENKYFKRTSLCFNHDRLKIIDSLVKKPEIKENLLRYFTIKYISKSDKPESNYELLKSYLNKSNLDERKKIMNTYVNSLNNLKKNSKLPSIKVLDYNDSDNDNVFEINSLINSPTVISFWSHAYYDHFKQSHSKISELRKKYPEVTFLVINIDSHATIKSKKVLKEIKFSCKNEYKFINPEASIETLAIYPITKTMLISKNKKIVNSNSNIFSINFEKHLLELINQ